MICQICCREGQDYMLLQKQHEEMLQKLSHTSAETTTQTCKWLCTPCDQSLNEKYCIMLENKKLKDIISKFQNNLKYCLSKCSHYTFCPALNNNRDGSVRYAKTKSSDDVEEITFSFEQQQSISAEQNIEKFITDKHLRQDIQRNIKEIISHVSGAEENFRTNKHNKDSRLHLNFFKLKTAFKKYGKLYRCKLCSKPKKNYSAVAAIRQHIKYQHFDLRFQCSECQEKYILPGRLRYHYKRKHGTNGPIKLRKSFIGKQTEIEPSQKRIIVNNVNIKQATNHAREELIKAATFKENKKINFANLIKRFENYYYCLLCKETSSQRYGTRNGIVGHIKIQHYGYKYPCKQCYRNFSSATNYRNHYRTAHKTTAEIKLQYNTSNRKQFAYQHLIRPIDNKYKCGLCQEYSQLYDRLPIIQRHIKFEHYGFYYKCMECNKEYKNQSYLRYHYKNQHSNKISKRVKCWKSDEAVAIDGNSSNATLNIESLAKLNNVAGSYVKFCNETFSTENSLSGNSLTEKSLSGNSLSGNTLAEDSLCGNTFAEKSSGKNNGTEKCSGTDGSSCTENSSSVNSFAEKSSSGNSKAKNSTSERIFADNSPGVNTFIKKCSGEKTLSGNILDEINPGGTTFAVKSSGGNNGTEKCSGIDGNSFTENSSCGNSFAAKNSSGNSNAKNSTSERIFGTEKCSDTDGNNFAENSTCGNSFAEKNSNEITFAKKILGRNTFAEKISSAKAYRRNTFAVKSSGERTFTENNPGGITFAENCPGGSTFIMNRSTNNTLAKNSTSGRSAENILNEKCTSANNSFTENSSGGKTLVASTFTQNNLGSNTFTKSSLSGSTFSQNRLARSTLTENCPAGKNTFAENSLGSNNFAEKSSVKSTFTKNNPTGNTFSENSPGEITFTQNKSTRNTLAENCTVGKNTFTEKSLSANTFTEITLAEKNTGGNTFSENSRDNNTFTQNRSTSNTLAASCTAGRSTFTKISPGGNIFAKNSSCGNTFININPDGNTFTQKRSSRNTFAEISPCDNTFAEKSPNENTSTEKNSGGNTFSENSRDGSTFTQNRSTRNTLAENCTANGNTFAENIPVESTFTQKISSRNTFAGNRTVAKNTLAEISPDSNSFAEKSSSGNTLVETRSLDNTFTENCPGGSTFTSNISAGNTFAEKGLRVNTFAESSLSRMTTFAPNNSNGNTSTQYISIVNSANTNANGELHSAVTESQQSSSDSDGPIDPCAIAMSSLVLDCDIESAAVAAHSASMSSSTVTKATIPNTTTENNLSRTKSSQQNSTEAIDHQFDGFKKLGNYYYCTICTESKKYTTRWGVQVHVKWHYCTYRYACPDCNGKYKNALSYKKHYETAHNVDDEGFPLGTFDYDNIIERMDDSYICSLCSKTYSMLNSTQRHIKSQHYGLRYKCSECLMDYAKRQCIKLHYLKKHNMEAPEKLETFMSDELIAETKSKIKSKLIGKKCDNIRQGQQMGEKNFIVSFLAERKKSCDSIASKNANNFSSRELLQNSNEKSAQSSAAIHTNSRETTEQPSPNSNAISTKTRNSLQSKLKATKELVDDAVRTMSDNDETTTSKMQFYEFHIVDNYYYCDLCTESYAIRSSMRRHIKMQHYGIRYKCSQCNGNYAKRYYLTDHYRKKHNMEAPKDIETFMNAELAKRDKRKDKMKDDGFAESSNSAKESSCTLNTTLVANSRSLPLDCQEMHLANDIVKEEITVTDYNYSVQSIAFKVKNNASIPTSSSPSPPSLNSLAIKQEQFDI